MSAETTRETRAGFAAVIGAPNAGKSTLVNRLVGEKVSIVTHKVQTTRFQVRGVMMRDDSQVILVDTPGIFTPKRRLDRAMVRSAWDGADGADLILHVVDVSAWVAEAEGKISAAEKKSIIDDKRIIKEMRRQVVQKPPMLTLWAPSVFGHLQSKRRGC